LIGVGTSNIYATVDAAGQPIPRAGGIYDVGALMYAAPITTTKTVGPGKNYSGLASWEAGEQGDLLALNQCKVAECYAMNDTNKVEINGWTTHATCNITITCPTTERHSGVWDITKYRLSTAQNDATLRISNQYVTVEYLQIENLQNFTTIYEGGTGITVLRSCIVRNDFTGGGNSATLAIMYGTLDIINCILHRYPGNNLGRCWDGGNDASKTINIINSVLIWGDTVTSNYSGVLNFINSYSGGGSTQLGTSFGTNNITTSATSDGSFGTITAPLSNTTFSSVTAPLNFHLVSTSALRNACAVHAKAPLDIDGQTRTSTTDIGVDSFVLPAPSLSVKTVKASGGDYTSLTAWEAAEQCDFQAVNLYKQVNVYALSDSSSNVVVNGWSNADSQRNITIYVPTTERHSGIFDTNKAYLAGTADFCLTVYVPYTTITGMQFSQTGSNGKCLYLTNTAGNSTIDTIIARSTAIGSFNTLLHIDNANTIIKNSLMYRATTETLGEQLRLGSSFTGVTVLNCTIIGGGIGIVTGTGSVVSIINTYIGGLAGNTVSLSSSGSTLNFTAVRTHDGLQSTTVVPTNTTTFVNISSDFHLSYYSLLRGAALLDARAPNDIDGQARNSTTDIGVDQYSQPAFQVITKTIGPGKDYTSLTAWEAGRQGVLQDKNTAEIGECYDFADGSNTYIDGWVTTPTNYIVVQTAAGNGHVGKRDSAKYALQTRLGIRPDNVTIRGIQFLQGASGNNSIIIDVVSANTDILIDRCLMDGNTAVGGNSDSGVLFSNASSTAAKLKVQNCTIYNHKTGITISGAAAAGAVNILGCTIVSPYVGISQASVGTPNLYIEYTYATTYVYPGNAVFGASRYNAAFTGQSNVPGTNPVNVPEDTTTFVNPFSNFHLVVGSGLLARGTTSQLTTDIDGQQRGLTGLFDTGSDQYSGNEVREGAKGIEIHPTRAIALGQV